MTDEQNSDRSAEAFLRIYVEAMRKLRPNRLPYACIEDFVLQQGREYRYQPLPRRYREGTPQFCFHNSGVLAVKHDLLYVEGYAYLSDGPMLQIHHAWCVERGSDRVIDVTTTNCDLYYGVAFEPLVWEERHRDDCACLIDDWEKGWPLMKMSAEELAKVVYKEPEHAGS